MPAHFSQRPNDADFVVALQQAQHALDPANFGFRQRKDVPEANRILAWERAFSGVGTVAFMNVSWHHANMKIQWEGEQLSVLDLVVHLQQQVWGVPPDKCTSPLDMSIIADTGGSIAFAYQKDKGLTPEGWLGFVLGYGSRSGVLISRFLAVREGKRSGGLGTALKLLQAFHAVRQGHYQMEWTFDPMRATNAYLNFNKLGATVGRYIESKYGEMNSSLYGQVPSHRFIVQWNLIDPRLHAFLQGKAASAYSLDLEAIPLVRPDTIEQLLADKAERVRVAIPMHIDEWAPENPKAALAWRHDMHRVLLRLIDAKRPVWHDGGLLSDPVFLVDDFQENPYHLSHFVAAKDKDQPAYYICTRKDAR